MAGRKTNECVVKLRDKQYLSIYIFNSGDRYAIPLGIKADETTFKKNQLTSKWGADYKEKNLYIQHMKNKINGLIDVANEKNVNACEYIRNYLAKEKVQNDKYIFNANQTIAEALEAYVKRLEIAKRNQVKEVSFELNRTMVKNVKRFDSKTTLQHLSIHWINDYCDYLVSERKVKMTVEDIKQNRVFESEIILQAGNTTIKRTLNTFIGFCKTIRENKECDIDFPIKEMVILRSTIKLNSEDKMNVKGLTADELNKFRALRPTLIQPWEINTYNAFMISCLTSLRYVDIIDLTSAYINSEDYLDFNNTKTKNHVRVPITQEFKDILNYYNGSLERRLPTIQRLNINLRNLLKRIPSMNVKELRYNYILNKTIKREVYRWENMRFHAGRKTFITRALANGATLPMLMTFTGIQKMETLTHYIDANQTSENYRNILNF